MTGNEEGILAEFFVMEELEEGEIVSDEESIFDEPAEALIEEEEMEETLVAFYESRKGGKKILLNGYDYNFHHTDKNGKEHYYCAVKNKNKCKGKMSWDEDVNEFHILVDHNQHEKKDSVDLEIEMFKRGMYRTVEENKCFKNRNLVANKIVGLSKAAKIKLGENKLHAVKNHLSRKKRTINIFEPENFDEIVPQILNQVIDGNGERIFKEKVEDPSRMLIFGTNSNIEILRNCHIWSIDATFKSVPMPSIFKQMLVVAGYCRGRFLPLVYVLMSRRTVNDYVRVFESLPLSNEVKLILTDYEMALIKALKLVIEDMQLNIKLKGCRFHFSKALLKKVKQMGLLPQYWEHGEIYALLRPFFMLPFVPVDEIIPCFFRCRRKMLAQRPELVGFAKYMARVWIGRLKNGLWLKPRYEHSLWNVQELILSGMPSTNNSIESQHKAFKDSLTRPNPPLGHFLEQLVREHALIDYLLEQPEKHHEDHRYYEVVQSFYNYMEIMFFFDDLIDLN